MDPLCHGSHVPSDVLHFEDAQSKHIKQTYFDSLAASYFKRLNLITLHLIRELIEDTS
jgi:hypothetical protein